MIKGFNRIKDSFIYFNTYCYYMKELSCPRKICKYKWNYKGKGKFYTSCPRCKTSVPINPKKKNGGITK